jgi:hypothetical protein
MRTLLVIVLSLTFGTLGSAVTRADQPSRFEVPERIEVREAQATDAPTHEVVLLADVVARPGETPAEALSRALHGEERVAQR